MKHYLFADILDSFANVVEGNNYDITLFSKNILLSKKSLLAHCRSKNLDGVFIVCEDFTSEPIKELLASEIPVVAVDYFAADESVNCVTSDNRRKMFDLTDYIIGMGHRNIVYVTGQDVFVTHERVKGFRAALKANGIRFSEEMIVEAEFYNLDLSYKITQDIMLRNTPPSVLIMPDDYCAISAYDALQDQHLRIPEDVSVAGFDGLEIGKRLTPSLTTIKQDTQSIGEYAAKKLVEMIDGSTGETTLKVIEGTLIRGESIKNLTK